MKIIIILLKETMAQAVKKTQAGWTVPVTENWHDEIDPPKWKTEEVVQKPHNQVEWFIPRTESWDDQLDTTRTFQLRWEKAPTKAQVKRWNRYCTTCRGRCQHRH